MKDVETTLGARLRTTPAGRGWVDHLDEDGKAIACRPATNLEIRMWNLLVSQTNGKDGETGG